MYDQPSRLQDGTYVMAVRCLTGELISVHADTRQHCLVAGKEIRKGLLVGAGE